MHAMCFPQTTPPFPYHLLWPAWISFLVGLITKCDEHHIFRHNCLGIMDNCLCIYICQLLIYWFSPPNSSFACSVKVDVWPLVLVYQLAWWSALSIESTEKTSQEVRVLLFIPMNALGGLLQGTHLLQHLAPAVPEASQFLIPAVHKNWQYSFTSSFQHRPSLSDFIIEYLQWDTYQWRPFLNTLGNE